MMNISDRGFWLLLKDNFAYFSIFYGEKQNHQAYLLISKFSHTSVL